MVISVIGILAAITFGISKGVRDSQNRARAKAELAILSQSLEQFKAQNGDYPWTVNGNPSQAEDHGVILFQALVGWMKFNRSVAGTTFDAKEDAEIPTSGSKTYLDVSKLTYVDLEDPEEYNPPLDLTTLPAGFAFVDPWGEPYVFLHGQNKSRRWEVFGYHLYSKGGDGLDNSAGLDAATGEMEDSFREEDENIDNIYAGE